MIMKLYPLLLVLFMAISIGCSNRDTDIENIETLEKTLYSNSESVFDPQVAENLVSHYESFVASMPDDTLSPSYLFKAGEVAMGMGTSAKAIELYGRVYKEYPIYPKAATALFLIGFVNETQVKNLAEAQKYYRKFLAEYPGNSLVDDAKFSLENLGKSDEDIIKEFEANIAKNKAQDTL